MDLKQQRESRGIKQAELAKILNVSAGKIMMIETGRSDVYMRDGKLIADTYGITLDDLWLSVQETQSAVCPNKRGRPPKKVKSSTIKEDAYSAMLTAIKWYVSQYDSVHKGKDEGQTIFLMRKALEAMEGKP
jgi:transcriptional regulator with XRE-family HTH domain